MHFPFSAYLTETWFHIRSLVRSTLAGPSTNLRSKLQDKAKLTAAMIQEITEELQAIEEESLKDEHDSEATQESDLE